MSYRILQAPFSLKLQEMSNKELKAYATWFHAIMPERIDELKRAVASTVGFEEWVPNQTPESLDELREWFLREVDTRQRTEQEIGEIEASLKFPIDIPDQELTNRTFSLAVDIGMYLGMVLLQNVPGTRWEQVLKGKTWVDYGQPVIVGRSSGRMRLSPVQIVVTLAYGLAEKEEVGGGLREIYDIWSKKLA